MRMKNKILISMIVGLVISCLVACYYLDDPQIKLLICLMVSLPVIILGAIVLFDYSDKRAEEKEKRLREKLWKEHWDNLERSDGYDSFMGFYTLKDGKKDFFEIREWMNKQKITR